MFFTQYVIGSGMHKGMEESMSGIHEQIMQWQYQQMQQEMMQRVATRGGPGGAGIDSDPYDQFYRLESMLDASRVMSDYKHPR